MAIETIAPKSAGIILDLTGATDTVTFQKDGVTVSNGLHLVATSDSDYQTRRQLTVKSKQPTLDSRTGAFSKDKKSVCIARPVLLSDGRVVFNTLRIEREVHPSTVNVDVRALNYMALELIDPNGMIEDFWDNGSL